MNHYVNAFSCATDDQGEVVLHFTQNSPTFDENGNASQVINEQVASLVMNREHAKKLFVILGSILKDDFPKKEVSNTSE